MRRILSRLVPPRLMHPPNSNSHSLLTKVTAVTSQALLRLLLPHLLNTMPQPQLWQQRHSKDWLAIPIRDTAWRTWTCRASRT